MNSGWAAAQYERPGMRLLLDTQVFLWLDSDTGQVPSRTRQICEDGANQVYLSIASVWEMQIKLALGKLATPVPPVALAEAYALNGTLAMLPIEFGHIHALGELPRLHGDPFDRMLVAQARSEGMTIVSAAKIMREYPVEVLWE